MPARPPIDNRNAYKSTHDQNTNIDYETGMTCATLSLKMLAVPHIGVLAFGLSFLVVGSVFANNCQLEPLIPVWLIIIGITLILATLSSFYQIRKNKVNKGMFEISNVTKIIAFIGLLFFLAWFICGNVWIYTAWGVIPDYAHHWFENGCNKSLYLLSFWTIIFMDAIVGIAAIGAVFYVITGFCRK